MSISAKKHFRNYKVVDELDENGKVKQVLRYFGDTYARDLPPAQRTKQKRLFLTMAVLADAAYLLASTRNIAGTRGGPSAGFTLGMLIPLFFLTAGSVNNALAKPEMTRNEYNETTLFLRFGGAVSAVLGAVLAVWQAVLAAQGGGAEMVPAVLCVCGLAAAAAAAGVAYGSEKETKYTVTRGMGTGEDDAQDEENPLGGPADFLHPIRRYKEERAKDRARDRGEPRR